MRPRSPFRNWLEYITARIVIAKLEWTPRPVAELLARCYVHLLDKALPRLRRIACKNLEMAFPEKTASERDTITDGVFHSIARMLAALARFPRIKRDNISEWIRYEGFEHVEEGLRRGRGVLFATAHLGNWELSAYAFGLLTAPMHVVVRPLDNPQINKLIEHRRALGGNILIEKKDSAREILRALAGNAAVGILIDQNSSPEEGVFVDFFGVPACANVGFAKIAARSGAAVIPGYALWSDEENRYVLRFYPPVDITGDSAEDTRRLHNKLEEVIRQYPGQWLWIHRRWKTRPPGEQSFY